MTIPNPVPSSYHPTPQVKEGALVDYEIKNPWASTRWWGILTTVVGGIVTCALALHYVSQDQVDVLLSNAKVIIGSVGTIVGVVITIYGSFTAKRPLGNLLATNAGKMVTKTVKVLLPITLLIGITGCMSRAEHAAIREGLVQSRTIADKEHREWSRILAGDNNSDGKVTEEDGPVNLKALPNIQDRSVADRNTWLSAREREHTEYDRLIETSRSNDQLFGK